MDATVGALRVALSAVMAILAVRLVGGWGTGARERRRLLAGAVVLLALTFAGSVVDAWTGLGGFRPLRWPLGIVWACSAALVVLSITSPPWLRRLRLARADVEATRSITDLLAITDEGAFLHDACLLAARITGSRRSLIAAGERVVAAPGLTTEAAAGLWRSVAGRLGTAPGERQRAVGAPCGDDRGHVLVVAGSTDGFGPVEAGWLGRFAAVIGLGLDKRHLAAVVAESQDRLRLLDGVKDAILTAVSLDVRTPLTAIEGLADTLVERSAAIPPVERREMLRRISRNAHRLDRVILDLLDLDRLRRGILQPKRLATNVGALVKGVVGDLAVPETHVVRPDVGDVIGRMDAAMVERILENLLSNAIRHTPPGTTITVRVDADDRGVALVVEDDGPGIPAEERARVFDVFQRGPASTGGLGLGLPLVARLAEAHGGRAWIADTPRGASVRVWLPEASEADPSAADVSGSRAGRI